MVAPTDIFDLGDIQEINQRVPSMVDVLGDFDAKVV